MPYPSRLNLPIMLVIALAAAAIPMSYLAYRNSVPAVKPAVQKPSSKPTPPSLSVLAEKPDWTALEVFQNTITRGDFERFLTDVFTTGSRWREFIEIDELEARIKTGTATEPIRLRFAVPGTEIAPPRHWRTASELTPAPADKPLDGVKIALDPGHIGGEWAKMEERWFVTGGGSPVCEGDMTLMVANLLKPRLEALGATVSLVRSRAEPVTAVRPADLVELAMHASPPPANAAAAKRASEFLFYRVSEIRARADLVNQTLKPDLVVCLHFNAEAWGDPNNPTLIDRTHLHLLLNGAYADDEVTLEDQRFALLHKLLERVHAPEERISTSVAEAFVALSGLPPYAYPPDSKNVRQISGNPYLWNRNLLANRLYDCPVIFMEPYVMNSTIDYSRIQAGDFEGLREIAGKMQPSIFREYADAVTAGLAKYYSQARIPSDESDGR